MVLVSVYIPTFNRLSLLKRAVDSVLCQTLENVELIVVDDGSTDGTVKFMEELAGKDSRVVFLRNKSNSGACYSRNKAILAAKGKFVTGLDDDDYFAQDRLQKFLEHWPKSNANVIGLCSNSTVIVGPNRKKCTKRPRFVSRKDLLNSNVVGNQVFALKETFIESGGFDEGFPAWQDLELWYRMLADNKSRIMCIKEATYVQDISHEHERISSGSGKRIETAMSMFIEKHKIEAPYRDFLKNSYAAYGFSRPSLVIGFRKVLTFKNFRSLRDFAALLVKRYIIKG